MSTRKPWSPGLGSVPKYRQAGRESLGAEGFGEPVRAGRTGRPESGWAKLTEGLGEDARVLSLGHPPCSRACPVGTNVKGYVTAIAEGRFEEAEAIARQANPMASVCGRICSRPCESECSLAEQSGRPVPVRALKAFVCDFVRDEGKLSGSKQPESDWGAGLSVAVVGAGPAGLSAARELARFGARVTVLDARGQAGGLLAKEVPEFRLEKAELARDIEEIESWGVTFELGRRLDGADLEWIGEEYDAVVLATGAHETVFAEPFSDSPRPAGLLSVLEFLGAADPRERIEAARLVVVVGATPAAVAAARAAVRAAGNCYLVLPGKLEDASADQSDLLAAQAEGVEVLEHLVPVGLKTVAGRVSGVLCRHVGGGAGPGLATKMLAAEALVVDGFRRSSWRPEALPEGVALGPAGTIQVDDRTGATGRPGFFAAGEAALGPRGVIGVVASGKRVAHGLLARLRPDHPAAQDMEARWAHPDWRPAGDVWQGHRLHFPTEAAGRSSGRSGPAVVGGEPAADEMVRTLEHVAVQAARTCLRCGRCEDCWSCSSHCPDGHLAVRPLAEEGAGGQSSLVRVDRQVAVTTEGLGADPLVAQVDASACTGCGRCEQACPYQAIRLVLVGGGKVEARVDWSVCRGCGRCTSVCPTGAVTVPWSKSAPVDAPSSRHADAPAVVVFHANGGALATTSVTWPDGLEERFVPCTGQVGLEDVLGALETASLGVALVGCEQCRFPHEHRDCPARDLAHRADDLASLLGLASGVRFFVSGSGQGLQETLGLVAEEFGLERRGSGGEVVS